MQRQWIKGLAFATALGMLLAGCSTGSTPAKSPGQATAAAAPASTQPTILEARAKLASTQKAILRVPVGQVSYAYGVELAKGLQKQGIELDPEAIAQGMKAEMTGARYIYTKDEMREGMSALQTDARMKQSQKGVVGLENRKEGNEFRAKNKTREGVVTLPSGLQYRILKAGTGPKPTDSDVVACYYRGTLIDGTVFDSTVHDPAEEREPSLVKVSDVLPGWREALKLMPVGSKWELVVPPDLAYSGRGFGKLVGPDATLIYEVELVAIKTTEADVMKANAPAAK